MSRMNRSAWELAVLLLTACSARGDGGIFWQETQAANLAQTRQEVVLAFYNDATDAAAEATYVLRIRYAGTPEAFAWVVPVPTTPTDVIAHASDILFDRLNGATAPRFTIVGPVSPAPCGGCACGLSGTGGTQETGLVQVEASGQAGIFDYVALTSTGGSALLTWLNTNGYAVPAAAATILDQYIQQDMHFLALRINAPAQVTLTAAGEIDIPPIQFTCRTARRFYPLAISRISAADPTEVVVYVLARHRAAAANVTNLLIDRQAVAYDATSPSSTNYEALFTQAIAGAGGRGLVTECANDPGNLYVPEDGYLTPLVLSSSVWPAAPPEVQNLRFLTRLRTLIARDQMDFDLDLQDAANDVPVLSEFRVTRSSGVAAASTAGQALAAVLLFGLLRVVTGRRRPKAGGAS